MVSQWVKKRALAKEVGVSLRTIDSWMAERKIPYLKVGGVVRFNPEAVWKALGRFEVRAARF